MHSVEADPSRASLLDFRYQLFSLTDIPPDQIEVQVGTEHFFPNDDLDAGRTLASIGIYPGDIVICRDVNGTKGQVQLHEVQQETKALGVSDLQAALEQVSLNSSNRKSVAGASSDNGHQVDSKTREFLSQVSKYQQAVCAYEDADFQDKARKTAPLQELRLKANDRLEKQRKDYPTYELALAKELLTWFKESFFTWVNSPDCWSCGKETALVGMAPPTDHELKHGGSRVEQHDCQACGATTRFPRYNDAGKLLETRKGRCGEWAQAFTLIARAAGLRVRVVHDWTDHVWTEIYTPEGEGGGRWVHADSCENELDKPLLYESGWKKKLNYCVATGVDCVMDVTRRYTEDFKALAVRRTLAEEGALQKGLARMNEEVIAKLPIGEREEAMRKYFADVEQIGLPQASGEGLSGRQSGSQAWINARGEGG
ncbi:unnamed protein product [Chondrus crispus]|uniref:Transglutaminase-like domain-containing protein n=1 Tax=Chondrus crispus TaxID=2769 RepID=R7QQT5_CHOCR|nr:unnamed protein product [Chondrus crispus]CDF39846.1 unnamed protein product [Chondrus crispus]|eukprot:XP_005710140.1 unnamed protein product [Chondrus crispus]